MGFNLRVVTAALIITTKKRATAPTAVCFGGQEG